MVRTAASVIALALCLCACGSNDSKANEPPTGGAAGSSATGSAGRQTNGGNANGGTVSSGDAGNGGLAASGANSGRGGAANDGTTNGGRSGSPGVVQGSLTDSRDGKTYRTLIVMGREWMAENLRYEPGSGTACPNDDTALCATMGVLYSYPVALSLPTDCIPNACPDQIDTPHQGICPSAWHLPTLDEMARISLASGRLARKNGLAKQRTGHRSLRNGAVAHRVSSHY